MCYRGQSSHEFSNSVWNPTLKGRCQIGVPWGTLFGACGALYERFWAMASWFWSMAFWFFGMVFWFFGMASRFLLQGSSYGRNMAPRVPSRPPKVGIVSAVGPQMGAMLGSFRRLFGDRVKKWKLMPLSQNNLEIKVQRGSVCHHFWLLFERCVPRRLWRSLFWVTGGPGGVREGRAQSVP